MPLNRRIRLGLVFSHNDAWIGGTYYILNLISALNSIPDSVKPSITVIIDKESDKTIIDQIKYPYLIFRFASPSYSFYERIFNKISRILIRKNLIEKRVLDEEVDYVFPASEQYSLKLVSKKKHIYWIPDFQEQHLPHLFDPELILQRNKDHRHIARTNNLLILSSNDAKKDFELYFSGYNCKIKVVNFAVKLPAFDHIQISDLLIKYKINTPYLICSNQFWTHKNHLILLKSILLLKEKGFDNFTVIFTGKEYDHRNPQYFEELKTFVLNNHIDGHVRFLGLIDRKEQLALLSNSLAIIQPSLFEGWSTIVEDAKALNKFILVSDIPVLREQINKNCEFFNPLDENDLSCKIESVLTNGVPIAILDYELKLKSFGINFISQIQ